MKLNRIDRAFQDQDNGSVKFLCEKRRVAVKACTTEIVNVRLLPLPDLGQSGEIVVGKKKWDEIP